VKNEAAEYAAITRCFPAGPGRMIQSWRGVPSPKLQDPGAFIRTVPDTCECGVSRDETLSADLDHN
jgi:hypothetical protein